MGDEGLTVRTGLIAAGALRGDILRGNRRMNERASAAGRGTAVNLFNAADAHKGRFVTREELRATLARWAGRLGLAGPTCAGNHGVVPRRTSAAERRRRAAQNQTPKPEHVEKKMMAALPDQRREWIECPRWVWHWMERATSSSWITAAVACWRSRPVAVPDYRGHGTTQRLGRRMIRSRRRFSPSLTRMPVQRVKAGEALQPALTLLAASPIYRRADSEHATREAAALIEARL